MSKSQNKGEFGKPKSKKEIRAEYEALKEIKNQVPQFTSWGIDQREMILAQVQTLEHEYTMEDVWKWWPSIEEPQDGDVRGACEDAIYWKNGGDVLSPAQAWQSQVGQPQKPILRDKEM